MKKKTINVEKFNEYYKENLSCSEIAEKLGHSCSVIYAYCKRNNINVTKKKGRKGSKKYKDLQGKEFHCLTVISDAGRNERGNVIWNCKCKCGKECIAVGYDLTHGKTKTCGCRLKINNARNWQGYGEIPKTYWSSLNNGASQRSLEFTITIEYANELFLSQNKKCKLSGLELSFKENSPSLDRIDNTKGYVKGNVQWVHKHINKIKQTFDNQYFIYLCKLVANEYSKS
jgi:hypothetical protein